MRDEVKVNDRLTLPARPNFEWADWKHGWPHKLYVEGPDQMHIKFYSVHLTDHPELVAAFNERFSVLGVEFDVQGTKIGWRSVR
jgi:hypothetical protein